MEFEAEIESLEIIRLALRRMLEDEIVPELVKRGCGAKRVEISFRPARLPPVKKILQLSRPNRELKSLYRLAELASESALCDDGFMGIRIIASEVERLTDEQIHLMEQEEYTSDLELGHLIERILILAGQHVLTRPRLLESYVPEHAYELTAPEIRTSIKPQKARSRPSRLMRSPTAINVMVAPTTEGPPLSFSLGSHLHRVIYTVGPERISGRWWTGRFKTRDYFEIEDEVGHRFWIFRVAETGKWYLHGLFD
jgi:protein ImuB